MTTKRCNGPCGRVLPLSSFGQGKRPGLYQGRCRECLAADARRKRASKSDFQQRQEVRQHQAEMAAAGLKCCARCARTLPLGEFNRNSQRRDGRYAYCKQCTVQIDAERRPKVAPAPPSMTYGAAHARLPSFAGRECCRCGEPAEEWAYDHADPGEFVSERGFPYSLDTAHYMPMCRGCHRKYDRKYRIETGTASPRGYTTKPCVFCNAEFWNASHHRKTCSPACESALRSKSQSSRQEREVGKHATLTVAAVRDIRARYSDGSTSANELARLYGVSPGTVWHVIYRDTWRTVA